MGKGGKADVEVKRRLSLNLRDASLSLVRRSSKHTADALQKSATLQETLLQEANQQLEDAHALVRTTSFELHKKQALLKDAEEKQRAAEAEAASAEVEARQAEDEVRDAELRKNAAAESIQKAARDKKARDEAKAKKFEANLPWFETEQERAEKEQIAAVRKKAAGSIQRAAAKRAAAKQVATEAAAAAAAAEKAAEVVEEALARAQAAETLQNWQQRQVQVARFRRFFAQHERHLFLILWGALVIAFVAAAMAWASAGQQVVAQSDPPEPKRLVGKALLRAAGRLVKRLVRVG